MARAGGSASARSSPARGFRERRVGLAGLVSGRGIGTCCVSVFATGFSSPAALGAPMAAAVPGIIGLEYSETVFAAAGGMGLGGCFGGRCSCAGSDISVSARGRVMGGGAGCEGRGPGDGGTPEAGSGAVADPCSPMMGEGASKSLNPMRWSNSAIGERLRTAGRKRGAATPARRFADEAICER